MDFVRQKVTERQTHSEQRGTLSINGVLAPMRRGEWGSDVHLLYKQTTWGALMFELCAVRKKVMALYGLLSDSCPAFREQVKAHWKQSTDEFMAEGHREGHARRFLLLSGPREAQ